MAKIDPIDTRQSMFEEPSNGSKATTYLPPQSVTSMHLSFSSDTITPTYYNNGNVVIGSLCIFTLAKVMCIDAHMFTLEWFQNNSINTHHSHFTSRGGLM